MIRTRMRRSRAASGTSRAALGGRSFCAVTRTAITAIQPTLITPSTTSIAISPALEPTQHSPNPKPDPAALAAAAAEVPLERRELVRPGGDRHRAGRGRPVRPVGREHDRTGQRPDRQVRPGEQRHRARIRRRGRLAPRPEPRPAASSPPSSPPTPRRRTRTSRAGSPPPCPSRSSARPRPPSTRRPARASPSARPRAVVLTAVMAGAEVVRASGFQARPLGDGASARPR